MLIKEDFQTYEEGIQKLKEAVQLRNSMGGALYYNILEENCCQLANKLAFMDGAVRGEIRNILRS